MRLAAAMAILAALSLCSPYVAAAPPQPPPTNVRATPYGPWVRIDWSASTTPVMPWTTGYEILRQQLAPSYEADYHVIGSVLPFERSYVDQTLPEVAGVRYCVRAVTADGPQECSAPAYYVDTADCALVYGSYTVRLDTQCLYTTDPELPIIYPWCAPAGAEANSDGTYVVNPRTGCVMIDP